MADYYTLLTNAGIAYETACKAAGLPIKLSQISVGDGAGAVYNPAATDTALKREVWRGPLNALFQDEKNPSWLLAEVTIPPDVGGWYVREAGIWTDTGILYAIVKYPESFKPILATSGSGKEFYIRSIFETSNAALVTLLIDDTVVKATRAWVSSYVADELAKLDNKQSVRVATTANVALAGAQTIDGVAVVAGDRVLVKNQSLAKDNGIWVAAVGAWSRAKDADTSVEVTSALTVSVEQGSTQADTIWQLVTDGTIVLGTTNLTFQNVTQGFAPLNSPSLLGAPTAPTVQQFDSSKLLANTEFVQRSIGNRSLALILSANTTVKASECGSAIRLIGEGYTVTLPPLNSIPNGASVDLSSVGTGSISIATQGADTFVTPGGPVGTLSISRGDNVRLVAMGAVWTLMGGSLSLPLSSTMAGPNFVTQPLFNDSKALATTEFTRRGQGNYRGFTSLTVATTLTTAAVGTIVTVIGTFQVTLPAANALPSGGAINFRNIGNGVVTVACGGADTINSGVGQIVSIVLQPGAGLELVSNGSASWWASGSAQLQYSQVFGSTPAQFDSSKLLVNSEFVQRALGNYSAYLPIGVNTALTAAHVGSIVFATSPSSISITLPPTAGIRAGSSIKFFGNQAGLTVLPASGSITQSGVARASIALGANDTAEFMLTSAAGWYCVGGSASLGGASIFEALFSQNGYQRNPSGLIEQWGVIPAIPANGSILISFPIAFPVAAAGFSIAGGASGPGIPGVNCYNVSATQVRFWNQSATVATQAGGYRVVGF